jgi:hypothetical protein
MGDEVLEMGDGATQDISEVAKLRVFLAKEVLLDEILVRLPVQRVGINTRTSIRGTDGTRLCVVLFSSSASLFSSDCDPSPHRLFAFLSIRLSSLRRGCGSVDLFELEIILLTVWPGCRQTCGCPTSTTLPVLWSVQWEPS